MAHYLATRSDERPLFFVQVGANDGIHDDPLRPYVLEENWRGILIEPQQLAFERLAANYAGAEGLTLVNAAISEQAGSRPLYLLRDEDGALDPIGGSSSFLREPLEAVITKLGIRATIDSVEVRCTTFTDLLADVAYLDLLQIDVEGFDLEILRLFDFDRLSPPIVHFEHRHLSPDEIDEAYLLLAERGYGMVREENDTTAYMSDASNAAGNLTV